VAKDNKGNGPP